MRYFNILTVVMFFFLVNSCIALRKDVDFAKAEIKAENNAKIKVVEDSLKVDLEKITKRLDEVEKTLQIDKKAQENKISLSFTTLDELKATIRDLNNRIDSVDVSAQKGGGMNTRLTEFEANLKKYEEQIVKLRDEVFLQLNELKPVDNLTLTKEGMVRLPENEEKSYNQLVDFTKSSSDGQVARKGWEIFSQKWPKSRKCDVTYWIGESYFLEKSYNNAIQYLGKIESEFNSCSKLEASYVRTAFALHYIDKDDVAQKVIDATMLKFPKTTFSDQIKELKKMISSKAAKKKSQPKHQQKSDEKDTKKGDKK